MHLTTIKIDTAKDQIKADWNGKVLEVWDGNILVFRHFIDNEEPHYSEVPVVSGKTYKVFSTGTVEKLSQIKMAAEPLEL